MRRALVLLGIGLGLIGLLSADTGSTNAILVGGLLVMVGRM